MMQARHLFVVILARLLATLALQVEPLPKLAYPKHAPYRFAWLISGQASRFIYKDMVERLDTRARLNFVGCSSSGPCPAELDVHIALSNTFVAPFCKPGYITPRYADGGYREDSAGSIKTQRLKPQIVKVATEIKKTFYNMGSRRVFLSILSDEAFSKDVEDLRNQALELARVRIGLDKRQWSNFYDSIPMHDMRLKTNGNMMYLRHLAYRSLVQREERCLEHAQNYPDKTICTYTHVLYTREDNVWLHPAYTLLTLARQLDGNAQPGSVRQSFFVDKFCGWRGAYSDKLYFSTRFGSRIMNRDNRSAHIVMMADWLDGSLGTPKWVKDPMQTESFFKKLLDGARANVTRIDFSRTEARYVVNEKTGGDIICSPEAYWHCTLKQEFSKCSDVTTNGTNIFNMSR